MKKIFVDSNNHLKSVLITALIILPPLFLIYRIDKDSNDPLTSLIPLIGFPIMLIILVPVLRIVVGNNAIYIIRDDVLYQINRMPSDPGIMANNARAAGNIWGNEQAGGIAAGIILLSSRGEREAEQIQLATDADYRRYLLNENETIQICRVLKMKKYHSGYKIKCDGFQGLVRKEKLLFTFSRVITIMSSWWIALRV